jgi:hypothetical protein
MRTSKDEYIFSNGVKILVSCDEKPPAGAKLFNGFDYQNQQWVHNGVKDIRTLVQLFQILEKEKGRKLKFNKINYA